MVLPCKQILNEKRMLSEICDDVRDLMTNYGCLNESRASREDAISIHKRIYNDVEVVIVLMEKPNGSCPQLILET